MPLCWAWNGCVMKESDTDIDFKAYVLDVERTVCLFCSLPFVTMPGELSGVSLIITATVCPECRRKIDVMYINAIEAGRRSQGRAARARVHALRPLWRPHRKRAP